MQQSNRGSHDLCEDEDKIEDEEQEEEEVLEKKEARHQSGKRRGKEVAEEG